MKEKNFIMMRAFMIVGQMALEYVIIPVLTGIAIMWLFNLQWQVVPMAVLFRFLLEYLVRIIFGTFFSEKYTRQGR